MISTDKIFKNLCLTLFVLTSSLVFSQDFSERVKDFISVDISRVAITNCTLIDG